MSRYILEAVNPEHDYVVVGWDRSLETYFGQVFDLRVDDDNDDDCVVWAGTDVGCIQTVEALAQVMAPYAVIPPDIKAKLEQDKAHAESPSPLQLQVRSLFSEHV